ncbi:hypothetical protein [Streptomyces scabiei]|uniref:hypothetical protein n=1 Tax=Streptomyces scabiei TaxID=1930 RepID=UPI0029A237FD|nr:hypothetical protein [Streptomyces scabiei]MDX3204744.1 hypothetical protein [Streptomyces scabiei]
MHPPLLRPSPTARAPGERLAELPLALAGPQVWLRMTSSAVHSARTWTASAARLIRAAGAATAMSNGTELVPPFE